MLESSAKLPDPGEQASSPGGRGESVRFRRRHPNKMRIAFVVSVFPAISETFILNQITGLIDLGHEVDVYAWRGESSTERLHPDVERYGLLARTRYFPSIPERTLDRRKMGVFALVRAWRYPGRVFQAARHCISERALTAACLLGSLEDAPQYDVVQCHFGVNGGVGVLMKRLGLAARVVVTFHAYELTIRKEADQLRYALLARTADLLTPVSDHWRTRLIELGCDPARVRVHRMGVDLGQFQFSRPKFNGTVRLLTVARLVEKKGVEYAIRGIARLRERYPQVPIVLFVIGDGPLRSQLEALARELDLGSSLRFLGWVTQEGIRDYMSRCDIFVLPSVTASNGDQEGIPVSLMEAMATGMPVVSTWHSGIPELVVDGKSGFLTNERDDVALADAVGRLVEEPGVVASMGEAGRRVIEEHYNIDRLNDQLEGIYESLLARV